MDITNTSNPQNEVANNARTAPINVTSSVSTISAVQTAPAIPAIVPAVPVVERPKEANNIPIGPADTTNGAFHHRQSNHHQYQHQHQHHHKGRGGQNGRIDRPQPEAPEKADFDFESSNAKFTKDDLIPEPPADFYNKKSSFFDNISSTAKDKAEGVENLTPYERRGEERKLNMETFGQVTAFPGRGGRGRGRGRGGFYRGRGRGGRGGRGGYQNQVTDN